jgi:hypothetical protein
VIEIEIVCVELGVTVSDDGIDMEKSGWGGGVEDWLDEPPSELLEPPQPNIKTTAKNPKNQGQLMALMRLPIAHLPELTQPGRKRRWMDRFFSQT